MSQRNPRTMRDMTILGGWLFADLLLALVVIFMASQPAIPKALPTPTPTATATFTPTPTVMPTPTQEPRLDFTYREFQVTVDFTGLLSDSPQAINDLERKVMSVPFLHNRSVGLAVVYGGAPTDNDIGQAQSIARKVYGVLGMLGHQSSVFQRASYYEPIFHLGNDPSIVIIDVYLFKQ